MNNPLEKDEDGPYIWTHSGRKFHFLAPTADEISIDDIAHHLSHITRFTGATDYPYSVAQHSLNVVRWMKEFGEVTAMGVSGAAPTKKSFLQGLLHDSAEAYINDLAGPIKHTRMLEGYVDIEQEINKTIAMKYGMEYPFYDIIKEADKVMAHSEALTLFKRVPPWADKAIAVNQSRAYWFKPMDPNKVRMEFMEEFISLM